MPLTPETGLVRFDFLHSLGTWLAPQLIRAFATSHPRLRSGMQGNCTELVDRVLDDEADIALSSPRPDRDDMAWLEMWRQPLALCVPADRPVGRAKHRLSLSDAAGEPFISTPKSFPLPRSPGRGGRRLRASRPRWQYESDELLQPLRVWWLPVSEWRCRRLTTRIGAGRVNIIPLRTSGPARSG